MDVLFLALGILDLIAGSILFLEVSDLIKLVGILLLTKGFITIFKSVWH